MSQRRRKLPKVIKVDTPEAKPETTSRRDPLNPAARNFFEELMAMDDADITDEFIAEAEKDPDKAEVLDLMSSMI